MVSNKFKFVNGQNQYDIVNNLEIVIVRVPHI
jgi:hypothetical protein